jgi:hypothetical protein
VILDEAVNDVANFGCIQSLWSLHSTATSSEGGGGGWLPAPHGLFADCFFFLLTR